jgi:hypothetical protein
MAVVVAMVAVLADELVDGRGRDSRVGGMMQDLVDMLRTVAGGVEGVGLGVGGEWSLVAGPGRETDYCSL